MKHIDEYLEVDLYLRDALTIDKKLGLKIGASSDLYYGREKSYKSDANRGRIYSTRRGDFIDEKNYTSVTIVSLGNLKSLNTLKTILFRNLRDYHFMKYILSYGKEEIVYLIFKI